MPYYVAPLLYFPLRYFAAQYSLSPDLVLGLVMVESAGDCYAVGDDRHSFGPGQLHVDGAGEGKDPCELLQIPVNLEVVCAYLADMIQKTGKVVDGISAYNQGYASWLKYGRARNPDYVTAVQDWQNKLVTSGWDWDHDHHSIRWAV